MTTIIFILKEGQPKAKDNIPKGAMPISLVRMMLPAVVVVRRWKWQMSQRMQLQRDTSPTGEEATPVK